MENEKKLAPLLSVIIVSYNEVKYIREAIDSCLNQSLLNDDYEIIIGDDGSDDGSIEIISEYAKKYENIKYFVMERNISGKVIASLRITNILRNAVEIARGKYIIFFSADDIMCDSQRFKLQTEFLENYPQYIATICGYKLFWDNGKEELRPNLPKLKYGRSLFWSGHYVHIAAFMFRRIIFNSPYLFKNIQDDTALIYTLACCGKWHYDEAVMFGYRQHDNSIMHKSDMLELYLIELLLKEESAEIGRFKLSSAARFAKPMNYCFKHRKQLKDEKYQIYFDLSKTSKKKIIYRLSEFSELSLLDRLSILFEIHATQIICFLFRIMRKVYRIIH